MSVSLLRRPELTEREVEVLLAWLRRDTKEQVCRDLYLALGTVNEYLTRIRRKYDALDRSAPTKAALLARALQDGLITVAELR
ncbi:LuxR C-terminal-related transcriptional regulator [Nocardia takedensis]|uniref:LuxR C-terminal-related transcriptional regulator n=1 Tax=Nocardia takedensis TaxID=259390 RepID=UPI0002F11915|nr:LuxR C-terminal-related transcriptional regulator [Nocardia takedensis]